jgi:hypothetical protein
MSLRESKLEADIIEDDQGALARKVTFRCLASSVRSIKTRVKRQYRNQLTDLGLKPWRNLAAAATEGPFGATATPVPVPPAQGLPLGPLSTLYPDTHVEAFDKRFKGSVGKGAVERVATGFRWAEGPRHFRAG